MACCFQDDPNMDNITDNNNTITISDRNGTLEMDEFRPQVFPTNILLFGRHLSRYLTVPVALIALLFNALVFKALCGVSPNVLKSKMLIQNSIIADIALGLSPSLQPLAYTLEAFKVSPAIYSTIQGVNNILIAVAQYAHLFAALCLVGDRMYAIIKPLTYHTTGYSRLLKTVLIAGSWILALILILPALIMPFGVDTLTDSPFHVKLTYGHANYNTWVKQYASISLNLLVFVLYLVTFVVLELQRRSARLLAESRSERVKSTWSLTMTYFLVHFSSLLMYLPGPLFRLFRDSITGMPKHAVNIISRSLVNLYIINIAINPIILANRIRVIRQKCYSILRLKDIKKLPKTTSITDTGQ